MIGHKKQWLKSNGEPEPPIVVPYPDTVRSLTPVYYYRLGEATGEAVAVDDIGGNDGTYGQPQVVAVPSLICDSDTAKNFAGVDIGVLTPYAHKGSQASISCLVNWNGSNGVYQWITGEDANWYSGNRVQIGMWQDKWVMVIANAAGSSRWYSNTISCTVPIGVDTHIVYTIDGAAVKIYVNKTLAVSTNSSIALTDTTVPMKAFYEGGVQAIEGIGDEFAYYDKVLSQTDVDALVDAWQTGCA